LIFRREPSLDVLVNNAYVILSLTLLHSSQPHLIYVSSGVWVPPIDQTTADGYDLTFGTNVIGHYLFTVLLLPSLLASPRPRVINVSSLAHRTSKGLNFKAITDEEERKKLGRIEMYNMSKFVSAYLTFYRVIELEAGVVLC